MYWSYDTKEIWQVCFSAIKEGGPVVGNSTGSAMISNKAPVTVERGGLQCALLSVIIF